MIIHQGSTTVPYSSVHCVVPARAGSKGLPSKNNLLLNGLPLAEHSIKFALALPGLSSVICSSDSSYLLSRSHLYSSVHYINRCPTLSSDSSTLVELLIDLHDSVLAPTAGCNPAFLLLQPTSPFRCFSEVSSALRLSIDKAFNSLVAVTTSPHHPCECVLLSDTCWRYVTEPPCQSAQRQDYNLSSFFITGSFYLVTLSFLREFNSFVGPASSFFLTHEPSVVDIDTPNDFALAKALYPLMLSKDYALNI